REKLRNMRAKTLRTLRRGNQKEQKKRAIPRLINGRVDAAAFLDGTIEIPLIEIPLDTPDPFQYHVSIK
ncbi:MAG: hypothetical protein ACYC5X_14445, partial [Syntrophales bacterium]